MTTERGYMANIRACVEDEPHSADYLFRKLKGLHNRKALTRLLRSERRAVAKTLERLAEEGTIDRTVYNIDDEERPTWVGFKRK